MTRRRPWSRSGARKPARSFRQATRWATTVGQGVAFLFILYGVWQIFFGNSLNGLWIAFIGWFLNNAAEASRQQAMLQESFAGITARDVMTRQCPTVPRDLPLDRLVNEYILGTGQRCFFVTEDAGLQGLITLHDLKTVPRERWDEVTAGQVMTPVDTLHRARPDEDVLVLLQRMDAADVNQMPVIDDGHLLGMITREHLLRYIRLRSELGI